jgi:hypothetical protein
MTIIPVSDRVPACLGIMCELHHRCARYAAVEDGIEGSRIGTCEHEGARPLFVPVRVARVPPSPYPRDTVSQPARWFGPMPQPTGPHR